MEVVQFNDLTENRINIRNNNYKVLNEYLRNKTLNLSHCKIFGEFHWDLIRNYLEEKNKIEINCIVAKNTIFMDSVNFLDSSFNHYAEFSNSTFKGLADFGHAFFEFDAAFYNCIFERDVVFSDVTFNKNAYFYDSVFNSNVYFQTAKFKGEVVFYSSIIKGEAVFIACDFNNKTYFHDLIAKGGIGFGSSIFKKDVNFRDATFEDFIEFSESTFNGDADFNNVTFKKETIFEKTSFRGLLNLMKSKNYEDTYFYPLYIKQIRIDNMKVYGTFRCNWDQINSSITTYFKSNYDNQKKIRNSKLNQYQILKENFHKIGDYTNEDKAYVEYARNKYSKSIYSIFGFIGDYGTNPVKVLAFFILIFFLFGVIYSILPDTAFVNNSGAHTSLKGVAAIYYSGITMLTIGYGDYSPNLWYSQVFSVLQGFFGVFLTAYFVVSITRKTLH